MYTLAQEYGALMLALEHRFYGASFPTPDMSIENLAFLSSEQVARWYLIFFESPSLSSDVGAK